MSNLEIREALQKSKMKQWQLADLLGMSEFTLSRKLRKELSKADKEKIKQIINAHVENGDSYGN